MDRDLLEIQYYVTIKQGLWIMCYFQNQEYQGILVIDSYFEDIGKSERTIHPQNKTIIIRMTFHKLNGNNIKEWTLEPYR